MAMQNDQPEGAREAFSEFYRRHAPWLLTTVRKSHAPRLLHGDDDALHDVVLDTMQLAYTRAETFELGSIPDPEHIRRRVRAWLGGIANNVVEDAVNALHSVPTPDPEDDIGQTILDTDDPEISELAKRLEKEIEGLPEREQDILRTWILYIKPGEANQRVPNGVPEALAARHNTTPVNIRKIRSRVIADIREKLENSRNREE